jgi:hypothetical protein
LPTIVRLTGDGETGVFSCCAKAAPASAKPASVKTSIDLFSICSPLF